MTRAHFRRLARLGTGHSCSWWSTASARLALRGRMRLSGRLAAWFVPRALPLDAIFMAGSSSPSHDGLSRSPLEPPARHSPCSGLSCSSRDPLPISTASPGPIAPSNGVPHSARSSISTPRLPRAGRSTSRPRRPSAKALHLPSPSRLKRQLHSLCRLTSPRRTGSKYHHARFACALPCCSSVNGWAWAPSRRTALDPARWYRPLTGARAIRELCGTVEMRPRVHDVAW